MLALAAIFDFYSWRISYRELLARKDPDESTWQEIIGSKDPTVFTVFLEDSAGLIGTFLAFLGIFLGRMLHNPYFDPIASITIGLLLAAVAILLGRESGALLLGERTNRARVRRLREIIVADSSVEEAGELLTMQMGADQVLLTAGIRFRRGLTVETLESAILRLEAHIRLKEPTIKKVFLEPNSLNGQAARAASQQISVSQRRHHCSSCGLASRGLRIDGFGLAVSWPMNLLDNAGLFLVGERR